MSMDAPVEKLDLIFVCSECNQECPASEFYWKKSGQKHSSKCRACYQLSRRAYQHAYMAKNREYFKQKNKSNYCPNKRSLALLKEYGLTSKKYDEILDLQGGGCAVCGSKNPKTPRQGRFCVDHNHETGEVRGLLCAPCNRGIGLLKDDPEILVSASNYLKNNGSYTEYKYGDYRDGG